MIEKNIVSFYIILIIIKNFFYQNVTLFDLANVQKINIDVPFCPGVMLLMTLILGILTGSNNICGNV